MPITIPGRILSILIFYFFIKIYVEGKIVASMSALFGIILYSMPIGIISKNFYEYSQLKLLNDEYLKIKKEKEKM